MLIVKLIIVVIRSESFLSSLHISNCLGSWVHDVPPYWWNKRKEENDKIVEHVAWSIVKFSENLIWSERMSVMVSMSLESEEDW